VSLARDQHDVAGRRTAQGLTDRQPSVADLEDLGAGTWRCPSTGDLYEETEGVLALTAPATAEEDDA